MTTPSALMKDDLPRIAPEGKMWVCHACGKTVKDRYGQRGSSWDESCFLNSALYDETLLIYGDNGRVTRILEVPDGR